MHLVLSLIDFENLMTQEPNNDHRKLALEHLWNWFSLHSTQRLQAVNFFLIAISFLSAAYVTAAKEKLHSLAAAVAILAMIVSFLFYRVERRIRALIHAAEDGLHPLQSELATSLKNEAVRICDRVEKVQSGQWHYSKVFRFLYFTTGIVFGLGVVYAFWLEFSATPGAPNLNLVLEALLAIFLITFGYEMLTDQPRPAPSEAPSKAAAWLRTILGGGCVLTGIAVIGHLVITKL